VFDAIHHKLAMVLIRQKESLRQAAADSIHVSANDRQTLGKRGLGGEGAVLPCFGTLIIGLALRIFEDFGLEERIEGIGGLVEEAWALRMELEGRVEQSQSIVDLGGRVSGRYCTTKQQLRKTHLELLGGVDLLVDVVFGLDVDGRESLQ
jgi:hypothetical protein